MNRKLMFAVGIPCLIIIFLVVIFLVKNPLIKSKKETLDENFKKIEKRYNDLLKRPLPKNEDELNKRIYDGEKLKNDHSILIKEAEDSNYFNNDIIDTKEKLLKRIDNKIGVLSDMVPTAFDITIKAQNDELQMVKVHIEELKMFRKKVEVVSESDNITINILIKEYESTLMFKKVKQE